MYYIVTYSPISGSSAQKRPGDFIFSAARHYERKKN